MSVEEGKGDMPGRDWIWKDRMTLLWFIYTNVFRLVSSSRECVVE